MKDVLHVVIILAMLSAWVYTRDAILLGLIAGQLGGVAVERSKLGDK